MISVSDEKVMRQYLLDKGFVSAGEEFSVEYLRGGVSCETVRVKTGAREFVIKQALPKLRVKEDWYSDIRRIFTEKDCLSVYYRLVPNSTPELYFCDEENYLFGMEAAPEQAEMWKKQLLRGTVDFRFGNNVASALATVHKRHQQRRRGPGAFQGSGTLHSIEDRSLLEQNCGAPSATG